MQPTEDLAADRERWAAMTDDSNSHLGASTHTDRPTPPPIVAKVLVALLAAMFWVVGGFYTFGAMLRHGSDKNIGIMVAVAAWGLLFIAASIAIVSPTLATIRTLGINALIWAASVIYIWA